MHPPEMAMGAPRGPAPNFGMAGAGLSGTVRSYNGSKGFGFIVGQGDFEDVMFSRNELPEDAREVRGQILTGRQVIFDAKINPDGRAKATRVQLASGDGQKLPGIVKSFSAQNGYGFVRSSCLAEDVYFQAHDFPGLAPGANLQGQLVLFEPLAQQNGKLKASRIQFQTRKIAEQFVVGGGPPPLPAVAGPASGLSASAFGGGAVGGCGCSGGKGSAPVAAATGMLPGVVKTFSEKNGYGFIQVPGLPVDIMFRQSSLAGGPVGQGASVQFSLAQGQDGRLQASQVIPVSDLGALKRAAGMQMMHAQPFKQTKTATAVPTMSTGQYRQGTVKSYNSQKGWGLISSPGIPGGEKGVPGDVFFMKSNLPLEARELGIQGRDVSYELVTTPDGKFRAQNVTIA